MTAFLSDLAAFRAARLEGLRREDGWLNITDRLEYDEGRFTVGSGTQNDLILSVGPQRLGTLERSGAAVRFWDAEGGELPLEEGLVPRLRHAGLLLEFTQLEGHYALRVRDLSAVRADFDGLRWFEPQADWRIRARWEALEVPIRQEIDTVAGIQTWAEITHQAVFERDGETYTLLATHGSAQKPMFVLRDLTARESTYPAARFLYGEEVTDTEITLDFNRAFTPPCAFSAFATCPLPPPQNVLGLRIEAGEKRPLL